MVGLPEEEAWARDCLRVALPGCAVEQHDDNSEAGMYDLTITYPDGAIGAVEVTAAADSQQLELWKLVPRHPTFALSPTGTCVARSTRVEEDGFAGGPSVGCAGGPLP